MFGHLRYSVENYNTFPKQTQKPMRIHKEENFTFLFTLVLHSALLALGNVQTDGAVELMLLSLSACDKS